MSSNIKCNVTPATLGRTVLAALVYATADELRVPEMMGQLILSQLRVEGMHVVNDAGERFAADLPVIDVYQRAAQELSDNTMPLPTLPAFLRRQAE
jgi:glycerol kinase